MSGPYHVHEGKALQSTSLSIWERAKNYKAGANTTGMFPVNVFDLQDLRFKEGTDRWGRKDPRTKTHQGVELLKGMADIKHPDGDHTYYEILFKCLGSQKDLKNKFAGMVSFDDLPENPDNDSEYV